MYYFKKSIVSKIDFPIVFLQIVQLLSKTFLFASFGFQDILDRNIWSRLFLGWTRIFATGWNYRNKIRTYMHTLEQFYIVIVWLKLDKTPR